MQCKMSVALLALETSIHDFRLLVLLFSSLLVVVCCWRGMDGNKTSCKVAMIKVLGWQFYLSSHVRKHDVCIDIYISNVYQAQWTTRSRPGVITWQPNHQLLFAQRNEMRGPMLIFGLWEKEPNSMAHWHIFTLECLSRILIKLPPYQTCVSNWTHQTSSFFSSAVCHSLLTGSKMHWTPLYNSKLGLGTRWCST